MCSDFRMLPHPPSKNGWEEKTRKNTISLPSTVKEVTSTSSCYSIRYEWKRGPFAIPPESLPVNIPIHMEGSCKAGSGGGVGCWEHRIQHATQLLDEEVPCHHKTVSHRTDLNTVQSTSRTVRCKQSWRTEVDCRAEFSDFASS
jgi:hypothetical protein